jgi:site-specific DNA recombinase
MTPRPRKAPPKPSRRAVGYVRVSTDEQRRSGLGIDAQESSIRQAAARHGFRVTAIHRDEGVSGNKAPDQRPGLLAAIAALKRGDVLIVAKRDRLSRGGVSHTAVIEAAIKRKGARVLSAAGEGTDGEEPQDEFFRDLTDSLAKMERKIIGKRTAAALSAKRARGERAGTVPYGYRLRKAGDTTLAPHARERRILRLMLECREAGYSLRDTAEELNRNGLTTRAGQPWRFEYVRSALRTIERHPEVSATG